MSLVKKEKIYLPSPLLDLFSSEHVAWLSARAIDMQIICSVGRKEQTCGGNHWSTKRKLALVGGADFNPLCWTESGWLFGKRWGKKEG